MKDEGSMFTDPPISEGFPLPAPSPKGLLLSSPVSCESLLEGEVPISSLSSSADSSPADFPSPSESFSSPSFSAEGPSVMDFSFSSSLKFFKTSYLKELSFYHHFQPLVKKAGPLLALLGLLCISLFL